MQGPKSLNPLSVRRGPPFIVKGAATVAHRRWKDVQGLSLSPGIVGQTHLMRCLRALLLYQGRQQSSSCPSLPRLASTRIQAGEACSTMLAGCLLRWCGGRVFTKICMPPHRCLASWPRSCMLPRMRSPSWRAGHHIGTDVGQRNSDGCGPGLAP